MAERPGVESVLSRLDDLSGRLATAKNLSDVQEGVGRLATAKQVIELQETLTKILTEFKGLRERVGEVEEATTKGLKKLREEVMEAIEDVPAGDGDSEETLAFMKEQVGEFKSMAKALIGDDATVEVIRNKVRGWLGAKGKKALTGGEED